MAFYKGYDKNHGGKRDAEMRGGFEDEGSRYSGAKGQARRGGNGGRYGKADSGYRFAQDTRQQPYQERGEGTRPRPYGERRQEQQQSGERGGYRSFRYESQGGYPQARPARRPDARPVRPEKARPSFEPRTAYQQRPAYAKPAGPVYARPSYDAPQTSGEGLDTVPPENLLSGRNPIREALKSGRDIEKLMVAKGELSGSAREIVQMAKERHVPIQEVERSRLDAITRNHQGMLAFASAYQYHTVEDMLALAKEKGEDPFLVVLDGVTDPQNLGAIIRTAACAGVHGVIVQERRAVGLTPSAVKASAGAIEHMMVARVTNLKNTLETLKGQGIWAFAADMDGEDYATVDFSGPMVLVIGAEGEGVGRLVLEACDKRVSLPMRGQIGSLNASVAAGILLYAAMRAR